MTFEQFFSKDYLFNPTPPSESRLYLPLILLFGLSIVFAVLVKIVPSVRFKKLTDRYFPCFLTVGVLGFIYLFCRYEELPFLGSRFFLLLILLGFLVWVMINFAWTIRFLPKHKKESLKEEKYNKYLPKAKSKK